MLSFAQNWSWITKSFMAMVLIIPMMTLLPMLQQRYGVKSEGFFIAWFLGTFLGFLVIGKISSTIPLSGYFFPIQPIMAIIIIAFVFGSTANVFVVQAMSIGQAPNPALPFAIVNMAGTIAYVLTWSGGKLLPSLFPEIRFSFVNMTGLILLAIGTVLVIYQPTK